MKNNRWTRCVALALVVLLIVPAAAQGQADPIAQGKISALQTKLTEAGESASSARKKLAYRRVIREAGGLLEQHQAAPNRFEVLGILFRGQQALLGVDDSAANRKALLTTAEQLAAAPNAYAAVRLDADLLLSQVGLAQQGADLRDRGAALRPLVDRYQGTEVEVKVIRIAMLMALEFGDTRLIGHLRQVIAERCPGDYGMINFQRDKLAGQVFGAPFVGQFKSADGQVFRLPMDGMGKTTALYFWSKEDDGLDQLKALAEGWNKVKADPELNAAGRYQFISFNLDGLPDAGEGLLREAGLDWPALHLPGGQESEVYKTYARNTPKLLTMTPTGYTAMVMSGATRVRPDRGWERSFQSMLARSWSNGRYASQVQSMLIGDFMVMDPAGGFDPAAPPEWKAVHSNTSDQAGRLTRTDSSVPEDKLRAIQACFVQPPMRYRLPQEQVRASYEKAEALCRQAIAEHPDADDLWVVRNRRIVALMGLWKTDGRREHYDAAAQEARAALEKGYPAGTDLIARFCLAREALRAEGADPVGVIDSFVKADGDEPTAAPTYATASLLALEIGERRLHEHYRRLSLDKHANDPVMWVATSFLMDRYHRYWLYHPPFTAGWTYGRRMGHFLAIGEPEDARRTFSATLKTLDGEALGLPEASGGKWTVIEFAPSAHGNRHIQRYGTFVEERPFSDINLFAAVLDDDAQAARQALGEKKKPDTFPTLLVPGGMNHPLVKQLGILAEDERPNLLVLRPDGGIAAVLSGMTMRSQHGNAIQNIIEWHDEKRVDEALARGDLEEAKRLAFALAPVEEPAPPDQKKKKPAKKLSPPHLRSRAKVYRAMGEWDAALADAQEAYLAVNSKAGWLSMRTDDLEATEQLRNDIANAREQAASTK